LKNKNVLVTGATGFLGKHLVTDLLSQGFNVSIIARQTSDLSYYKDKNITIHYGDITNRLAILEATLDQSIVFHLAGLIAYKKSERAAMNKVNIEGTANVIDACITQNSKLLYLSSVVTVGASFEAKAIDEDFHYNLSQFDLGYFETKRAAEKLVVDAVKDNNLEAYIVNPSTIYGAGDASKGSRKTQIKVAQGNFNFYPPGGVNVVYVNDVIRAIHQCLNKGVPGRRYIICGDNMTIKELFSKIAHVANVPPPSIALPKILLKALGYFGDLLRLFGSETSLSSETAITSSLYHWFSCQRAQDELGFKPTNANVAINESISWMKENGLLKKS
jgi:dihydroflavonol-4-reductase